MDIPCDGCGGDTRLAKSCNICAGKKVMLITACPMNNTPDEVWEAIQKVDMTDTALPRGGGWDDQTAAFGDAYRLVKNEHAKCRAEIMRRCRV